MKFLSILMFTALLGIVGISNAQDGTIPAIAYGVRWSPDGRWIGVGTDDGAWLFDLQSRGGDPIHLFPGSRAYTLAFDPLRPRVAVADNDNGQIHVFDLERVSEVFTNTVDIEPGGRTSLMYDLQYSDDGQLLAVTNGGALYIVDAGRVDQLQGYYEAIPRGQREDFWIMSLDTGDKAGGFIAGDWSGRILVYDASSPRPQEEHDTDLSSLLRLERIPGGSELIVNTFGTLYRYDVRSNELDLLIEDDNLNDFDLSPDGDLMAVGLDSYWLLYDVEQDAVLAEMPFGDSNNRVYSLAFSPSSDRVAVMGTDGHVAIWDVNSGQIVTEIAQFDEAESPKWR